MKEDLNEIKNPSTRVPSFQEFMDGKSSELPKKEKKDEKEDKKSEEQKKKESGEGGPLTKSPESKD